MTALCEQLIGTWKLISYVEKPVDGSTPLHVGAVERAGPQAIRIR